MLHPMIPLLVALTVSTVPVNLTVTSKNPLQTAKSNPTVILADDPAGPDPHGSDPHDEQHDYRLPANSHELPADGARDGDTYRREDPYGGQVPDGPAPY